MNHFNEESLYRYFDKTIKNESAKIINDLEKELKIMRDNALKNVEQDLEKSKKITIDAKKKILHQKHQKKLSELKHKYNLQLMEERNNYVKKLVENLLVKINSYIKTEDYVKKMEQIIAAYDGKIAYIELSKDDILNKKLTNIKIKTNNEIIGGLNIALKDESFIINATLNAKIEDVKKWFHENSKLFVIEK